MITVDETLWPLVIFRSRGVLNDAQFDQYLRAYDRVLGRRELYAALFDAREAKPLEVGHAKRQAKWIADNSEALKKYNVGIAFVIPSPMIRGVLKAILWMRPMPQPHIVFQTVHEALPWLIEKLRRAGLEIPDVSNVA